MAIVRSDKNGAFKESKSSECKELKMAHLRRFKSGKFKDP